MANNINTSDRQTDRRTDGQTDRRTRTQRHGEIHTRTITNSIRENTEGLFQVSRAEYGERIILRWIFRKLEGVMGTGWSWLRIGTGGGHLWVR
jgi:hypothetical protein